SSADRQNHAEGPGRPRTEHNQVGNGPMQMLNTLRTIVQEVNSAKDLRDALEIIVSRVQEAMKTSVCSVYLLDPESNRYILMATRGLHRSSVGKVSLAYSEGLVGLVGSRE